MGMIEELERESLGVEVSGGWCGALLYADDNVLIAEACEELQKKLDEEMEEVEPSNTWVYGLTKG